MKDNEGYVLVEEGVRLYYRTVGTGPNTVVIANVWLLVADFESFAQDPRLIFYDSRGRGGSDAIVDESLVWTDDEIDDLEAVRQYFGLEKTSLIGWSYLGGVTALYAMKYPECVSRMVLMCSVSPRWPPPHDDFEELGRKGEARIDPEGVKRLEEMRQTGIELADPERYCREHNNVYLPRQMGRPEALTCMRSDPCVFPNEWPQNLEKHWQKHFPAESMQWVWRSMLSSLKAPTLVIHGTEDLITLESSREWVTVLPQANLLVIEGSGHFPHLEAPKVFFPAVGKFLRSSFRKLRLHKRNRIAMLHIHRIHRHTFSCWQALQEATSQKWWVVSMYGFVIL